MQNNSNNRKILNSKKDLLPSAEIQNINCRNKKSATSIKRNNSNNKSHNTNIYINNHNHNNASANNNLNNNCNNGKISTPNNFHTKLHKSNGYTKQIISATGTSPIAKISTTSITENAITASSVGIPQNCGSNQEGTANDLIAPKSKRTAGTSRGGPINGVVHVKSKAILNESFSSNQNDTISSSFSSSQQSQKAQQQSKQHPLSNNKARHHSFNGHSNGLTVSSDRGTVSRKGGGSGVSGDSNGAIGGGVSIGTMSSTNKTKKSMINPTIPETTTTLAIIEKQSTELAVLSSTTASMTTTTTSSTTTLTKTKTSSTSASLLVASNGNSSNANSNSNGVAAVNNNNNKNFQIPSDILDDLASRFVINVPDMELSNLIRICFQIELAHWFYLDFFCTGTDEEKEILKPIGMKYFATQLFQHIPFLSEHLPKIDTVLEDWKNYKLAVPTYGAILISEDLQYCLLVQSYFAKSSWGFPKGKVNETEDPEHCATREVFEETGYDITGLLVPKDYIEAVINDQYTRLYIVCNVSLDTVFEPRTRNEIRCCVWFPIDSLPNNKNDAISKAKLGQNANSFFMILPFVKRLKKWVNEKRAKAGIVDVNNGGAVGGGVTTGTTIALGTCVNTINSNNNTNNSNNNSSSSKSNDRRKYSSNSCQNNAIINTISGAILKSPSLGYVGEIPYNSGKKNRQQHKISSINNVSCNTSKNVAGCFELSEIEATTFITINGGVDGGKNAVAASAAANARSKRQRHKSMGDLENMHAFNNSIIITNSNSCTKNLNNQTNNNNNSNNKRVLMQKMNILNANDNHYQNNDNAVQNNGSSSRRQLFHSQSQNDGVVSERGIVISDQNVASSFSFIREERQQQQRSSDGLKYVQQNQNSVMMQYFTGAVSITDEQTRKHIRQRAKSHSDKACNNNNNQQQQQFKQQQQQINDCYFSNNKIKGNKNSTLTITSRPNLQRQGSLVTNRTTMLKSITTTASNIGNNSEYIENGDNNVDTDDADIDNEKICHDYNNDAVGMDEQVNDRDHELTIHNIDNTGAGGEIILYGDKKLLGQQQKRRRRYTTATAPTMSGNELIAWNSVGHSQRCSTAISSTSSTTINENNLPKIIKPVVEASAIETQLIEEQKLIRQLTEGVNSQKNQQQQQHPKQRQQQQQEILPYILNVQQEHPQQPKTEQKQQKQFPFSQQKQQQQQQHQQYQHHPLQHSASSPGLATWKNFTFTKNLISNVFL